MKMKMLEKDKDFIKVEILEPDDTVLYLLIHGLLLDDSVDEAKYNLGHPTLDKPVIYVKVNSGKPQTALKRAAKSLSGEFKEFRELFEKQAK